MRAGKLLLVLRKGVKWNVSTTRRLANIFCLAALLLAFLTRLFFGQTTLAGLSGARWAVFLVLAICFIRLAMLLGEVLSRKASWGRLLLPALVALELLRVASGAASRVQQQIFVVTLEMAFLIGAVLLVAVRWKKYRSVEHLEDVFEDIFNRFLPLGLSRLAARELVLLWEGLRWCLRGFRLQTPPGFGYVEQSYIKMLPLLIVMGLLTEGVAYEILMHKHPLVRMMIHIVEVWAVLWCFGLYATMKLRPHQIGPELVRLRCGLLSSCEFNPRLLLDVEPESGDSPLPKMQDMARITAKGTPRLQLRLREPIAVQRMFSKPKPFDRILVSADDPMAFRAALLAAKQPV